MEKIMEYLRDMFRSPLLATIFAYGVSYIMPILLLDLYLDISIETAVLLWALVLPLITLGALAGAGIGEDLIRLRLIRNPVTDWHKLGMPKIKLSFSEIQVGGFLLVVFAIQAVITTTIFGIYSLATALGFWETTAAAFGAQALVLALFNKGRGATKEMTEVWREGGFKVSTFQLFLPVYVFLGVTLSSALEVFVSQKSSENAYGVLASDAIGLANHEVIAAGMLAIQNFVLITTAIYIFRKPPGTAERRLIKEVPKFYGDDLSGYLFIHKKLKSDRSVENLLQELAKYIRKNPAQAGLIKGMLQETLTGGTGRVQTAASETLLTIIERQDRFDQDYYDLIQLALNSEYTGARIYAVRSMRLTLKWLEGEAKEEAIIQFHEKIMDQDPVISWDTSLALQRVVLDEPAYRGFVLALMIKTLNKATYEGSINAISRFLNRISKENTEVGHMAISILGVQLSSGEMDNIDNTIQGIRAIIRANPYLSTDLIDVIAIGIDSQDDDIRYQSYLVLSNLAEYGSGQEAEVLQLILRGVDDESEAIQKISFDALSKDVKNHPELTEEIFTILLSKFTELRGDPLLGSLEVIAAIVETDQGFENQIFDLIQGAAKSSTPDVRASVFEIMAILASKSQSLAESIYLATEENLKHENDAVREQAVTAIGEAVAGNSELARAVYRKLNDIRNDPSARVQLAAIEALGHVASASRQYSDEIFQSLQPLLNDDDWQVRLAALNGLYAASKERSDLSDNLIRETSFALTDNDRTIRGQALDILNFVVDRYRNAANTFLASITNDLGKVHDDVKATLYNALSLIVDRRGRLAIEIIKLLGRDFDNQDIAVRMAVNEVLQKSVEKISRSREDTKDTNKLLNTLLTDILKAANHSNPAIRKSSYEGITTICVALPNMKVSKRGRTTISRAQKHEKDVGLADFLENCRVRSVPPLTFD
jgi:energy-converting hydrogenase Eha subunit B